jgi:hypothetical protein
MDANYSQTAQKTVTTSDARITLTELNQLEQEKRFIPPVVQILALREIHCQTVTIFSTTRDRLFLISSHVPKHIKSRW